MPFSDDEPPVAAQVPSSQSNPMPFSDDLFEAASKLAGYLESTANEVRAKKSRSREALELALASRLVLARHREPRQPATWGNTVVDETFTKLSQFPSSNPSHPFKILSVAFLIRALTQYTNDQYEAP